MYASGHADLGVEYQAGSDQFTISFHFDGSAAAEGTTSLKNRHFAPTEVATRVPDPPAARPAGQAWDFVGLAAGEPLWFDPQVNEPSKPFLGLSTQLLHPAEWASPVRWTLTALRQAPDDGQFSLWQTNVLGEPFVAMATADGITLDDVFLQSIGGHDHFTWAFAQPGIYELELTVTGTHTVDGAVMGSGVVTFLVGSSTKAPSVAGDVNDDGQVDLTDFGVLKSFFGTGTTRSQGDLNDDLQVDLSDFGILKAHFGQTSAVPEPPAGNLGLIAAAAVLASALLAGPRSMTPKRLRPT